MTSSIARPSGTAPLYAALWMMGAVTAFTSMAVAGRAVSIELDTFEIMAWRSLIGMAIVALVLSLGRRWHEVTPRRPGLHLARNIAHFSAQNLWFYALAALPLAQVFAFEFTAPLWVLVLSPLLLGERLTRPRAIAAILGFLGIVMVARPGAAPLSPALLAAAGCAVGFAFTYMLTRRLTTEAPVACILWWMTASQTVLGFACAGIDGVIAAPSQAALPWIGVIAAAGLGAHFCIANALRLAPATLVMPFDFLRLPVIAVVGLLLYGEPVGPLMLIGATLILGGNYLNIRAEAWRPTNA
ncbi:DMT family transporter [Limimaricola soesokkakensis]|uniref:DMT family transporter n=3 Tax=Limimaricola soesokkakensis TaxID=1343159 RepID=UPI0035143757